MDINALLKQAKDELGQTVIKRRVSLLKTIGEYKKVGGQEDYQASLLGIVNHYGSGGVMVSLVREVLHDTEQLNDAIKALVDAGEIKKGEGKRDFLLTPVRGATVDPSQMTSPQFPAPSVPPVSPSPTPTLSAADDTED